MASRGIPFPRFEGTEMSDLIAHLYFLGYAGEDTRVVVLDMTDVTTIDMTGLVAFGALRDRLRQRGVALVVCCAPIRIRAKFERADLLAEPGVLSFANNYAEALALCRQARPA